MIRFVIEDGVASYEDVSSEPYDELLASLADDVVTGRKVVALAPSLVAFCLEFPHVKIQKL